MAVNTLYYGDNLEVLRRYVQDESVDLVYLDPPFQSGRDHNVIFERHDRTRAAAQIKAFEDTWRWNTEAARAYEEVVEAGGDVSRAMQAFRKILGQSDMMAYLAMMAPRLVELQRVLKPTGSLYLHCDPTASHYLKLLLDAVFLPKNFRAEIVWKRTHSHGDPSRTFGAITDTILFYSRSDQSRFNPQFRAFAPEYATRRFSYRDADGRAWQSVTLRSPNPRKNLHYPYTASNGVTYHPHPNGWSCDQERMQQYDHEGRLHFPTKPGGQLRLKMYLDESKGVKVQNLWDDIFPINSQAAERLGYPTQKPISLLERILQASSNPGDVVLDPFCGCGTAVHAAQKLGRKWIGIDITHLATNLIKHRLRDAFGQKVEFAVVGEPTSLSGAEQLAEEDRFQFQCWALGFVGARATEQQKKGADRGIDGRLYFHEDSRSTAKQIIFSVKSGGTGAADIRDLRGTIEREGAAIGCFITLREATKPMLTEAAAAGFYMSPWGRHPRIQILTIRELLEGKQIDHPAARHGNVTLRKAVRERPAAMQYSLPGIVAAKPRPTGAPNKKRARGH